MAYHFDPYDNSLIIDGFEQGIADSPFQGIADMRNVNVVSVPGEASVNFSTAKISSPVISATVVTSSPGSNVLTFSGGATGLENGMAIVFSSVGGLTGVSTNTPYWVFNCSGTPTSSCQLHSDFLQTVAVTIGGAATGSPTFTSYNVQTPKYFAIDGSGFYWMVDSIGQVWSTLETTTSGFFCFSGNKVPSSSNASGNGLVYYQASDGTGYLFVIHNSSIDYTKTASGGFGWQYQWNPATGTNAGYATTPTKILKTAVGVANSHEAFVAPDSRVYFCDANYIDRFYQTSPTNAFNPLDISTYTPDQTALLPTTDIAQCLTFLGTNVLVGGQKNVIYPWDRFDSNFNYPILIAENNIVKMVTVNTNTYIFAGNRGRIYITNGSQAQLYKKIPDHISGTVEPYFTWGGAVYNKNQLYFSLKAQTNAQVSISQYGGVWAIDTDTKAIRLANKLSYGTYAGYATALIAQTGTTPAGTGLYIGWDSGASTYGIDATSSTPYTNSEATIDSDLIPIGTFQKPRQVQQVEYRLVKPLVSGESVTIKSRLIFNTSDTGYTSVLTDSAAGNYSSTGPVNFGNAQWLQFQIVVNSTPSNPSYTRLKEIRVTGLAPR